MKENAAEPAHKNIAVPLNWHRWLRMEAAKRDIQMNAMLLLIFRHFKETWKSQ